ncbi:MAG TPA: tetratricopeptide repeat protein [Vicinamibacterales bacterium]|nr:tetratricopeptide repeat protein [Vicinamibacterales bacterium]
MFGVLLLTTLLAATPAEAQASQLPTQAEAAAPASQGDNQAALDAFRRRAAANPRDLEARLGIARVHVAMGRPELAEPVYQSVLLEAPRNMDAMIGVGTTLIALDRIDEAIVVLDRAAKAAPQNPEALAALGRAHLRASRTALAVSYLRLAVAVAPTPENTYALEEARRAHGHTIQVGGLFEAFNGSTPNTGGADVAVNVRLQDRLRLLGRGQFQDKFGFSEERGGVGLAWHWRPDAVVYGHVLVGPGNEVLPRADVDIGVSRRSGAFEWTGDVRVIGFDGATLTAFVPQATWWTSDRVSFGLRYILAVTDYDGSDDLISGHSGALTAGYRVHARAWVNLGYSRGIDNFDTPSPDRIGRFNADTVTGGIRLDLRSLTSVFGTYEYQRRSQGQTMSRVTASVRQSF